MTEFLMFALISQPTIYFMAGWTGLAIAKVIEAEDDSCGQ